jgi:hypothetical protein
MKTKYWPRFNPRTGKHTCDVLKYDFGRTLTVRRMGRNWKVKIYEAQLDHNQNFVCWRAKVINYDLWMKMCRGEDPPVIAIGERSVKKYL